MPMSAAGVSEIEPSVCPSLVLGCAGSFLLAAWFIHSSPFCREGSPFPPFFPRDVPSTAVPLKCSSPQELSHPLPLHGLGFASCGTSSPAGRHSQRENSAWKHWELLHRAGGHQHGASAASSPLGSKQPWPQYPTLALLFAQHLGKEC